MWIIELIADIFNLLMDIHLAKRYGWGSFLWNMAAFACAIVTIVLFSADLYVLGTLGIIASVACLIAGCRRLWCDVKIKREDEVGKHEQDNKKEYQTPWGQERQSPWKSKDKIF